ncbi:lymphocyte expansion molecule [Spea bombifrons]|uniref:lymphocyte expansion molecule n=1 Tax=Spea bombifrons TaxID=233779 RepID=UPI00234BC01C|nr:lymphocyte expansion molecule [Spea bombifrons]
MTSELVRQLGPGSYEATSGTFSSSVLQRTIFAWKREEEMKRMAEIPNLCLKESKKKNRRLMQNTGPGRYNNLMDERPYSGLGTSSTRATRFQEETKFCCPGPGTYGNPYTLLEESDRKRGSNKGLMDSKTAIRQPLASAGSGLGPGTYNIKGPIDEKLQCIANEKKRRPGKAFHPRWYRPPLILEGPEEQLPEEKPKPNSLFMPKSFVDVLESKNNKRRGQFGKLAQYPKVPSERVCCSSLAHCPRSPNSPGPGHYEIKRLLPPLKESAVPFHSSAKRFDRRSQKLFCGNNNPVGVGQYNLIKQWKGKSADCYQWPIPSKTVQILPKITREKTSQGLLEPIRVWTLYSDFPRVVED